MKRNQKTFLNCFEAYKEDLKKYKARSYEPDARDTFKEAQGFLIASLTFDIIESGENDNGFLNYWNQLSEIYYG